MNIFMLALKQLDKEHKPTTGLNMLNYAEKIRRYLDIAERNKKVAINRYKKTCSGV